MFNNTTTATIFNNTLAEAIADASRTSKGRVNADRVGKAAYKELRRIVDTMRLPAYECRRINKDAQVHDGDQYQVCRSYLGGRIRELLAFIGPVNGVTVDIRACIDDAIAVSGAERVVIHDAELEKLIKRRRELKDIVDAEAVPVSTQQAGVTQAQAELARVNARIDELESLDYTKTKDLKISSPTAFFNAVMLAFGKRFDGYLSLTAEEVEAMELARKEARKAARKAERARKKATGRQAKAPEVTMEQDVMDVIANRVNG